MKQMTESEKIARLHETASKLYRQAVDLAARGQSKAAGRALRKCLRTRQEAYTAEGRKSFLR